MLEVYLVTLALAVGLGLVAVLLLQALSRTARFAGLFQAARGMAERPRWGGLAMLAAFGLTPFVVSALSAEAAELFEPKSDEFVAFLVACAFVCAVGFYDDLRPLSWRPRLLAQLAAASAVSEVGYSIDDVGLPWGPEISLGLLAAPVTVAWVVFMTNAINWIDGRDGVSSGVAVLSAVTLAMVAVNADHPTVALLLIAIAGAGLGILPFHLPPASVYVGDSGAYLLGFILGALSIRAATGVSDAVFIAVPMVALGFPILDTGLAVVRRLLNGRHPLHGDEDHIHHRLELSGFGPRGLVVVIYTIAALFAAGALLLHYVRFFALEVFVLLATLALVTLILTRLGYLLSLWNSAGIVWLRRRLRWVDESAGAYEAPDGE